MFLTAERRRISTGVVLTSTVAFLTQAGLITGGGPSDPVLRKQLQDTTGWRTRFDLPSNHTDMLHAAFGPSAEVRRGVHFSALDEADHEHYHVPERGHDTRLTPGTGALNVTGQEPAVVTEAVGRVGVARR